MIIKATRLQAWALAGGGGKSMPSPSPLEKVFWLYWGPFCYFFFIWVPFCYVFVIFGDLFAMWGHFCYFLLHGGVFWGFPLTTIFAGAHDCKLGGFESMLPGNFFV